MGFHCGIVADEQIWEIALQPQAASEQSRGVRGANVLGGRVITRPDRPDAPSAG